jgi:hypothetical protein
MVANKSCTYIRIVLEEVSSLEIKDQGLRQPSNLASLWIEEYVSLMGWGVDAKTDASV